MRGFLWRFSYSFNVQMLDQMLKLQNKYVYLLNGGGGTSAFEV